MNEDEKREAKLVILSIAKLRDFCNQRERCKDCPLCMDIKRQSDGCLLTISAPSEWDPDEALYRIAYEEGRKA